MAFFVQLSALWIFLGRARLDTWVRLDRFARERDWARPSHLSPRSGLRWHCGATPASRNFTWFEPFAHGSHFATCGSSLSLLCISRFAASLSVTDFSILGASVSFRKFHGLGASLAVFVDSCLGSSVALRSARWSTPTVCGLWTSSTLREKGLGSVGIGILWLSLLSREVLESVQLGQGSCASSVVLGFHGMLEYWLKLQVCWWTYLALTLDVSLLGV